MPGWMKHKLKSRLLGEISITSRYAEDTILMAESEEELKSLLMKVKEESEKAGLKLNNQKTKMQTKSSADRITTLLSLAHQRKRKQTNKKLNTNLTLYKANTNHWATFRRAETKRKKVYSLEAWERRPQAQ